jgi:hypothetical protein
MRESHSRLSTSERSFIKWARGQVAQHLQKSVRECLVFTTKYELAIQHVNGE